ncbi:MAG: excalibur calcium-binding domain-containing protein [Thiothrix sp.]
MKLPVLFALLMLAGCVATPSVDNPAAAPKELGGKQPVTVISATPSPVRTPQTLPPKLAAPKKLPETVKPPAIGKSEIVDFVGYCGSKRYCTQMQSCQEARFYLNKCGLDRLDKDNDGIPCESLCGN